MFLGLDLGTTNVKAAVFNERGHALSRASKSVRLLHTPDGGIEQDFEEIWSAVLSSLREAAGQASPASIRSVGISSQGGAMQIIDRDGKCAGRVISWMDQRGAPFDEHFTRELGQTWFEQRIMHGGAGLSIGQLLRLHAENPETLRPPNRVRFVGDLVVERLGGQAAQDGTSAALTLLYDPRRRDYAQDLLARLFLHQDQLPHISLPTSPAGGLTTEVAQATGLDAGIPIGPAVHDQYASALGTRAIQDGTVMVGAGTAWVLLAVSGQVPRAVHSHALICHHLVASLWGQILSMVVGGSVIGWAAELGGMTGADCARIDHIVQSVPEGANGVQFWPFLTASAPVGVTPGTRGRLSGLQLQHQMPDLLRAVIEGLAFELKRNLDLLRKNGYTISKLVMSGGAAESRVTPSILADVTALPVACHGGDASLLGAGILARALAEPGVSLAQLAAEMASPGATHSPTRHAQTYAGLYAKYLKSLPLQHEQT